MSDYDEVQGEPCECCGEECHLNGYCFNCEDFPAQSACPTCGKTWCECWTCERHGLAGGK